MKPEMIHTPMSKPELKISICIVGRGIITKSEYSEHDYKAVNIFRDDEIHDDLLMYIMREFKEFIKIHGLDEIRYTEDQATPELIDK